MTVMPVLMESVDFILLPFFLMACDSNFVAHGLEDGSLFTLAHVGPGVSIPRDSQFY